MNSYQDVKDRLVRRAAEDEGFRARFVADPKSAVQEELGAEVPDDLEIKVHEDGDGVAHFVLPPSPRVGEQSLDQITAGSCGEGEGLCLPGVCKIIG